MRDVAFWNNGMKINTIQIFAYKIHISIYISDSKALVINEIVFKKTMFGLNLAKNKSCIIINAAFIVRMRYKKTIF